MSQEIISKIFNWTKFCQNKYERKFQESIYLKKSNSFPKNLNKKNAIDLTDSRIYLGGLRYAPFSISLLLKNLPMPWTINNAIKLLIHDSKSLVIIETSNKTIPEFLSAFWNIFWILNRQEKINRKYFKRINFPLFDDDENSFDIQKRLSSNKSKILEINKYLENSLRICLCLAENICQHSRFSSIRPVIYQENPLKISIVKIEFQSGLFFLDKGISHIKKLNWSQFFKFFPSKNKFSKTRLPYNSHNSVFKKDFEKKNLPFFFLKKNKSLSKLVNFDLTLQKRYLKNFYPTFYRKMHFFRKFYQKNSDFLFETKKKKLPPLNIFWSNEIFLFDLITPFFFDIFFWQKRVSFYLKYRFYFSDFISPFYNAVPNWNTNYLERILLNLVKTSQNFYSLSRVSFLNKFISINNHSIKKKKGQAL